MVKKLIALIAMVGLVVLFISGCASQTGLTLAGAMAKSTGYRSLDSSSEIKFNLKYNNFPNDNDNMQLVNDMFSNISLKVDQSIDLDKQQSKSVCIAKLNGLSADFESYLMEDSAWVKLPVFSKYLKFDMTKANGFNSKEKYLTYQKQMPILMADFTKKYIANYKFKLEDIKDNGNVTIQTSDGAKDVKEIQVTLSDSQFKEFLKYAAIELLGSEDLKTLIVEAAKLIDEDGTTVDAEFEKEIEEALSSANSAKEEINSSFDEAIKFLKLQDQGLVAKFYIDNNGDIVSNSATIAFRITEPGYSYSDTIDNSDKEQSVDVTLSIKSDYWNINKGINIVYPAFDTSNTIEYKDYPDEGSSIKSLLNGYKAEKSRKRGSTFYIGSNYATVRGEYVTMNKAAYSKNNTNYIPARNVADALNVKLNVSGKTIKFSDGTTSLVLNVDSKKATLNGKAISNNFAPEVKNGTTMVPIKLVVQSFNAKLSWDKYSNAITVETEK